ncbi:MAG TPA: hypothetical protein VHM88_05215 [Candidatus Acidoferrales bacterium]|nr:hypothetical protein [Candidatus Acidoferrales bacterium]
MHLIISDYLLAGINTVLEGALCVLIVRRGLYRRLPLFSAYIAWVLVRAILLWWAYHVLGFGSQAAWYLAYVTQGISLLARGLALGELCWRNLRTYRGIWALAWRLLCAIALLLLCNAALDARGNIAKIAPFILTAERGLELAVVGILVLWLGICRYYRISLEPVQKMIALGMGFYSAVQVLNNSFVRDGLMQYFHLTPYLHWWNGIRMVSFQAALVIWLLALRKPLPERAPAPTLLPQRVYDELSPQVNYRLRGLNERLLEILRSRWHWRSSSS